MNQKTTQYLAIGVIVISVLVSGYVILGPKKQEVVQNQDIGGLAPIIDGKQVIKMTVYGSNYDPEYFRVKAGIPVRWEITSSGQPGCDSGSIITKGFGDGTIYLNPNQGQVTVSEFTVQNPGVYNFGCPMFMVRGKMEVVN